MSRTFRLLPVAIGIALTCAGCEGRWEHAKVEESEKRGSEIVVAMNSYFATEGRYPPTLEVLVPAYMRTIKPPTAGDRHWVYRCASDGKSFDLAFEDGNTGPVAYITQAARQWSIDTR